MFYLTIFNYVLIDFHHALKKCAHPTKAHEVLGYNFIVVCFFNITNICYNVLYYWWYWQKIGKTYNILRYMFYMYCIATSTLQMCNYKYI